MMIEGSIFSTPFLLGSFSGLFFSSYLNLLAISYIVLALWCIHA
jgi:hypothetical protein